MAIEGLKNNLWTPPVNKDRETGGKKREKQKSDKRKNRNRGKGKKERSRPGKIDIRI